MSPSLTHVGRDFCLASSWLHISCACHLNHCESCGQGPCRVTADVHCLWLLPSAPSPRVISEPSGIGSDVAIHLELYRAENPTASGWPVVGLWINRYMRTKKLLWWGSEMHGLWFRTGPHPGSAVSTVATGKSVFIFKELPYVPYFVSHFILWESLKGSRVTHFF